MNRSPNVYVIAGPNGAGKTTFANFFLLDFVATRHFVNADSIAAGLSPFAPDLAVLQAGRIMLERIDVLVRQRVDFGFETTFAGKTMARRLARMKRSGYCVHVTYLWLDSPDLAVARVAERVRRGGHDVPEDIVRRRYGASIRNLFRIYLPLADQWAIYDNSSSQPTLVIHGMGSELEVANPSRYSLIKKAAQQ